MNTSGAPHPNPLPARGEREGPAKREGEGPIRQTMDALYRLCAVVSGSALVLISVVIPWGVFTRYVLNSAASWPEPMAILLTIVLTFFGAAACYRTDTHMSISILVRAMSRPW